MPYLGVSGQPHRENVYGPLFSPQIDPVELEVIANHSYGSKLIVIRSCAFLCCLSIVFVFIHFIFVCCFCVRVRHLCYKEPLGVVKYGLLHSSIAYGLHLYSIGSHQPSSTLSKPKPVERAPPCAYLVMLLKSKRAGFSESFVALPHTAAMNAIFESTYASKIVGTHEARMYRAFLYRW